MFELVLVVLGGLYILGFAVCLFLFRRLDRVSDIDAIRAAALLWPKLLPALLRDKPWRNSDDEEML